MILYLFSSSNNRINDFYHLLQYHQMNIKHNITHISKSIQLQDRRHFQQQYQTQYDLLLHKIKQLQSRISQDCTIVDTLKFNNQQLDRQLIQKTQLIHKLRQQNKYLRKANQDLEKQLQARRKSADQIIRQIRQQCSIIKQKNVRMCQIVHFLQKQIQQFERKQQESKLTSEGLRKRIQQYLIENENIRKKLAKSQVQSQKYKLKAIQGQKYWSSKLQKCKLKEQQNQIEKCTGLQNKYKQQTISLKADIFRYQKMLKIKDQQIKSLEHKISQLLIEKE